MRLPKERSCTRRDQRESSPMPLPGSTAARWAHSDALLALSLPLGRASPAPYAADRARPSAHETLALARLAGSETPWRRRDGAQTNCARVSGKPGSLGSFGPSQASVGHTGCVRDGFSAIPPSTAAEGRLSEKYLRSCRIVTEKYTVSAKPCKQEKCAGARKRWLAWTVCAAQCPEGAPGALGRTRPHVCARCRPWHAGHRDSPPLRKMTPAGAGRCRASSKGRK